MSGPEHLAVPSRRSAGQRLLLLAGAALSATLLAVAGVLGYFNYRFGQIERFDVLVDTPAGAGEPRNYLLVGSDSREDLDPDDPSQAGFFDSNGAFGSGMRTDTIMVLRVDPDERDAAVLSFPRDLYVEIADTGERNRINVAFSHGRQVLADTIRENFDIPIHHYVEVDFAGFQHLVDTIGGVPVYFSEAVRDDYSGLRIPEPGCAVLDGYGALAFTRARHLEFRDPETGRWRSDPSSDFGRISRQQLFIRNTISKAVSEGLTDPGKLQELVGVGVDFVGLDPSLDVSDILSLGRRFADFDADSLQSYTLPAEPFRTRSGASVVDLDEREAEPIFNIFRGREPGEVTAGMVEVSVLNGVGEPGLAADITAALEEIGFAVGTPGNTEERSADTAIRYATGSETAAERLARHVTTEASFAVDDQLDDNEVVLVAGEDFTTLHEQPSPTIRTPPSNTAVPITTTSAGDSEATPSGSGGDDEEPPSTTTEPLGYTPEEPPRSVDCG